MRSPLPDESLFHVKPSDNDHWFDVAHKLIDEVMEYKMKYVRGQGDKKEFKLYAKTEVGFCFKGTCVGATPEHAFNEKAKEKNPLFTFNIKATF